MDSEVFSPLLEQFMLTPLVCWVKTVGQLTVADGSTLSEYVELVDGIYLNEIMLEINPKATVQRTNKKVNNDPTLRIQNLSILIRQIKSYYQGLCHGDHLQAKFPFVPCRTCCVSICPLDGLSKS